MGYSKSDRHIERYDVEELVNELHGMRERICDLLRLEGLDYSKSANLSLIVSEGMKWLNRHDLLYKESQSVKGKVVSRKSAISERTLADLINHKDLATKSAYESLKQFIEFFKNPNLDYSKNPKYKVKVNLSEELLIATVIKAFEESAISSLKQTYTKAEEFRNVFEIYKHLNISKSGLPDNLISNIIKGLDTVEIFDPMNNNLTDFSPTIVFSPLLTGLAALLFEGRRLGIGRCELAYDFKNSLDVQKFVLKNKPEMFFVPTYAIDDSFLSSDYIPLLLGPSTEQMLFYQNEPTRNKPVEFVFQNEANSTPMAIYKHIEKHNSNLKVIKKITGTSSGFLDAHNLFKIENANTGNMIMRGEPEACVYKRLNLGLTQSIHSVFGNKTFYKNTANPCFLFVDRDYLRNNRKAIQEFKASFSYIRNKLLFDPFSFEIFLLNYIRTSPSLQKNPRNGKQAIETTLFEEIKNSIFDFEKPEEFCLVYS